MYMMANKSCVNDWLRNPVIQRECSTGTPLPVTSTTLTVSIPTQEHYDPHLSSSTSSNKSKCMEFSTIGSTTQYCCLHSYYLACASCDAGESSFTAFNSTQRDFDLHFLDDQIPKLPPKKRYSRREEASNDMSRIESPEPTTTDSYRGTTSNSQPSHGLGMKCQRLQLKSDEKEVGTIHEERGTGCVNTQPVYLLTHPKFSEPSPVCTSSEEPLDLSRREMQTNEHKIDQEPLLILEPVSESLFSCPSDVSESSVVFDISETQKNEQTPWDDDTSSQLSSRDVQPVPPECLLKTPVSLLEEETPKISEELSEEQFSSECLLLPGLIHEEEMGTASEKLSEEQFPSECLLLPGLIHEEEMGTESEESSVPMQKPENTPDEYPSLISSIANDGALPELNSDRLQGNGVELFETTNIDVEQDHLKDHRQCVASVHKEITEQKETNTERKCGVEKTHVKMENSDMEEMAVTTEFEDGIYSNEHSIRKTRKLRHRKRKPNVYNVSFTRLPRSEQIKIDPERARRLREENNAACRKNRSQKGKKLMEMEKQLEMLTKIVQKYVAA